MLTAEGRYPHQILRESATPRSQQVGSGPHFSHGPGQGHAVRPVCWGLSIGVAGMLSQMRGVAQAAGYLVEFKRTRIHSPWRWLPLQLVPKRMSVLHDDHGVAGPPPPLVIACGRHSVVPTICLKRQWGERILTVFVQDPIVNTGHFDLVVAPQHDGVSGNNVIATLGAVHHVTSPILEQERQTTLARQLVRNGRPTVTVLVGGPNKYNSYAPHTIEHFIHNLRAVVATDHAHLLIVTSRRTPPEVRGRLNNAFSADHVVWNGSEPNPYLAALAVADFVVVTADSVSMASEAAATGKPVFVQDVGTLLTAFRQRRFHRGFAVAGITRPFEGRLQHWKYRPPDDTDRVAEVIRRNLKLRMNQ